MRALPRYALGLAALLACRGVCGGDALTPAARKEDPRLERRVTLSSRRLYACDLLDLLSRQAGVHLEADERDGAADMLVAAFLRDVPLGDAMEALRSLPSYRKAEWLWEREGTAPEFRYRLARSLAAQKLAATLRQRAQDLFEKQADTLRHLLSMTPEQQADLARRDTDTAVFVDSPRNMAALHTFFDTFAPDMQKSILRGEQRPSIPLDQLPDQGRAFVRLEWGSGAWRNNADGTTTPLPYPDHITVLVDRPGSLLAPALLINLPGAGAGAYIGGRPIERQVLKETDDAWLLEGDARHDAAERRRVAPPSEQGPPRVEDAGARRRRLQRRLAQLAGGTPLSLLARLPSDPGLASADPDTPCGRTAGAFLSQLTGRQPPYQWKWRAHILLLTPAQWFWEDDPAPRWLVRSLREAERAGGGYMSFADMARAARALSPVQMARLADEEWPVMGQIAAWRDLWVQMAESPLWAARLRSAPGVPLSELPQSVAGPLRSAMGVPATGSELVRLAVSDGPRGHVVELLLTTPDGRSRGGIGMVYVSTRPPDPEDD